MPSPTISRDRLVSQLQPLPRLLRIIAPAGYGKTTLARALLRGFPRSGICDLAVATDAPRFVRGVLEAIAASEDQRRSFADRYLALGQNATAWIEFGRCVVRDLDAPCALCLENGERIADRPDVKRALEDLLPAASSHLHVVSCTRVDLNLHLAPFAGPDDTLVVDAADLRFDREEISRVFTGLAIDKATFDRIALFSQGWPMVVMMLFALAKRGRLKAALAADRDDADLYSYLADEVCSYLDERERSILYALAAIPEPTASDIAVLFGATPAAAAIATLERDTPFVTRGADGILHVHPAIAQMIASRIDTTAVLERLFAALPRDDGGLRAARIALHLGRPGEAAAALHDVGGGYWISTPSRELTSLLSMLPSEIIVGFPHLWNVATYARAYGEDPVRWIREGERVYDACDASTPQAVRSGVSSSLMNAYIRRGCYAEMERFAERILVDAEADPAYRPMAETIVAFWRTAIDVYRGRRVDIESLPERFPAFWTAQSTRALIEYDMIARQHRIDGDRVAERVALERAMDLAYSTGIPYTCALTVMDAAFGAWFWGEDDLFLRYLERLEATVTLTIERATRHFIGCARGAVASTPVGTEKLKSRAYAFTIAAALESRPTERRRYLHEAVLAADTAQQPFAQVIARVALALASDRDAAARAFTEAERIADMTESPVFRSAVRRVRDGDAPDTMLSAFAARFAEPESSPLESFPPVAQIDLKAGTVMVAGATEPLTEREAELVTLLALQGTVHRDDIVDALWPDLDGDRAAATLKTYVSRLRRAARHKHFVVLEPAGYRLGMPANVHDDGYIATRFRRWSWFREPGSSVRA